MSWLFVLFGFIGVMMGAGIGLLFMMLAYRMGKGEELRFRCQKPKTTIPAEVKETSQPKSLNESNRWMRQKPLENERLVSALERSAQIVPGT